MSSLVATLVFVSAWVLALMLLALPFLALWLVERPYSQMHRWLREQHALARTAEDRDRWTISLREHNKTIAKSNRHGAAAFVVVALWVAFVLYHWREVSRLIPAIATSYFP